MSAFQVPRSSSQPRRPHPLPALVQRLGHEALSSFPLSVLADGRVVGDFYHCRLSSVFQPIVDAKRNEVAGHHGYLRVAVEQGDAVAPWGVFSLAADDHTLVKLDRLTRTLHALNYFSHAESKALLFVHVEQRLLSTVTAEHGRVFEGILGELGQKPERVVISLPAATGDNAPLLVRSALNYKGRGYKIMLHVRDFGDLARGNLFLAEPHFVQVDVPSAENAASTARVIQALRRADVRVLARKIETAEQAEMARDLGFDLLQGHFFGVPGVLTEGERQPGSTQ